MNKTKQKRSALSAANHTPGPWKQCGEFGELVSTGKQFIEVQLHAHGSRPSETVSLAEIRANAQLIAAAPELLEACQQLIYRVEDGLGPEEFDESPFADELGTLRKAIAKAEGKE